MLYPPKPNSNPIYPFGNPEARASRALERKAGKRAIRRDIPPAPHKLRAFEIFRARWGREDGPKHRSRRFANLGRAQRFVEILCDANAQERWGKVEWVVIERASGFISEWREVGR